MSDINVIEKSIIFDSPEWAREIPLRIHVDKKANKAIRMEVMGRTGWLMLYPTDDPSVFKTLPECTREPTTIFSSGGKKVYSCDEGYSSFKLISV